MNVHTNTFVNRIERMPSFLFRNTAFAYTSFIYLFIYFSSFAGGISKYILPQLAYFHQPRSQDLSLGWGGRRLYNETCISNLIMTRSHRNVVHPLYRPQPRSQGRGPGNQVVFPFPFNCVFSCCDIFSFHFFLFTAFFGGACNSFVHVVVHAHYGLSAIGPQIRPYLWWKRCITKIQLVSVRGRLT